MGFTTAITLKTVFGNKRVHHGTYVSASSTAGGDIDTGLRSCEAIRLIPKAAAVATNASVVNESLPVNGSAVTIVTDANQSGYWEAWGY